MDEVVEPLSIGGVVHVDGSRCIIQLSGEFDEANIATVAAAFADAVATDQDVTLDLAEVTFASSVLLRTLICLQSDLADRGARVVLSNTSPVVRRLFEVTSTTDLFCES